MKPAAPKTAFADFEDGSPAFGVLDADLDLDGGEHGPGGHASADKLPDADFFNGAAAEIPASQRRCRAASRVAALPRRNPSVQRAALTRCLAAQPSRTCATKTTW